MNTTIEFIRKKDYKKIEDIGQGGTGKTVLLFDDYIKEYFVCKKYSPYYESHKNLYFDNFVDEIKLLHLIYHINIVRVFNYYLYPEHTTGYILMEYVKGESIRKYIKNNPDRVNDIFEQVVRAFRHLEENKILHRDIRPDNIMVTSAGIVKVIDFGFGKKISFEEDFEKDLSLNWRYDPPEDFSLKIYDFKTEVYFIGKLFEEIIQENSLQNFSYLEILKSMVKKDYSSRVNTFFDIDRSIIAGHDIDVLFEDSEKQVYRRFAGDLSKLYNKIDYTAEYKTDIEQLIVDLGDVYRNSMLEEDVQNTALISRAFLRGKFYFNKRTIISVEGLGDFVQLLKSCSPEKRRIILHNLWNRIDNIDRYTEDELIDLPF